MTRDKKSTIITGKEEYIYGDGLQACPNCGNEKFHDDWRGNGPDGYLAKRVCTKCHEDYPMKAYIQELASKHAWFTN